MISNTFSLRLTTVHPMATPSSLWVWTALTTAAMRPLDSGSFRIQPSASVRPAVAAVGVAFNGHHSVGDLLVVSDFSTGGAGL